MALKEPVYLQGPQNRLSSLILSMVEKIGKNRGEVWDAIAVTAGRIFAAFALPKAGC
jgi:hypothetical protein